MINFIRVHRSEETEEGTRETVTFIRAAHVLAVKDMHTWDDRNTCSILTTSGQTFEAEGRAEDILQQVEDAERGFAMPVHRLTAE